jgi:hypothetical protein
MKKFEALYDWPVNQIRHLTDSTEAEAYSASLGDVPQAAFTTLTERIRGLGADLSVAKAARNHFARWNEIYQSLEDFKGQFNDYPNADLSKFQLFLLLADKIAQSGPVLDMVEIEVNHFEIRELGQQLPLIWFCRENVRSFIDSTAVFSCCDLAALASEISASNLSPNFVFHFLASLGNLNPFPTGHAVLVKRISPPVDLAAIQCFVRLAILMTGRSVHSVLRYTNPPEVLDGDALSVGHPYDQWSDVLDVLSEYNSRDEVLLKYLTIYHVIENFMFKLPIVGLERQRVGRIFSIRDFQTLYDKTKTNEIEALKRLFRGHSNISV